MSRRRNQLFLFAALSVVLALATTQPAGAQDPSVLAEMYGRGVHAYYAGQYEDANRFLTSAIDAGTQDPRAYYFRGIVSYQLGNESDAESDWDEGAKLEAAAGDAVAIGRSLSRFQGSARLKLESYRQDARFKALAEGQARSDQRMKQLGVSPAAPALTPAAPAPAAPPAPAPAVPSTPLPENPFAADAPGLAGGDAKVESTNALEGLDSNPFADDPDPAMAADAAAAGDSDPFGGGAPAAPAGDSDPFGSDPFSAPAAGGGEASDPFGGDPFGGDPFGN